MYIHTVSFICTRTNDTNCLWFKLFPSKYLYSDFFKLSINVVKPARSVLCYCTWKAVQKSCSKYCNVWRLKNVVHHLKSNSPSFFIPPPQNVGGAILDSLCRVGRVGRSVRPSPIRVRSITPLLIEGFPSNLYDTFTSTRGCSEPMLPMCQLKVKVTVKGQIFN